MKISFRKCPHCGYRYPIQKFLGTILFKRINQSWECHSCGKPIKLQRARHMLVLALQMMWLLAVLMYKNNNTDKFEGFFIYLIALLVGYVGLSFLNGFSEA